MKPLKIKIIAQNVNGGLEYQRLHLPLRHLRREMDFSCVDYDEVKHIDLHYSDVIVTCHCYSIDQYFLLKQAKEHYGCKIIVDLDDLLTQLPADHPGFLTFKNTAVAQILQLADCVVFSTEYLAIKLGHLCKKFVVINNTINEDLYKAIPTVNKPYKNCFTTLWTGGQSHRQDIADVLYEPLSEFMRKYQDIRAYFHVLSSEKLHREFGHRVIFEPEVVNFLDYPRFSASYPADIGLVPLAEHEFNNCKSDLKLLELGAHGIPLLASPRPDFIRHKKEQIMLYADSPSQWVEQLTWALEHPEELAQIGQRAKEYVWAERTSHRAAKLWREIILEAL